MKTLMFAFLVRMARLVGQTVVAVSTLGWVVDHCGEPMGDVVVHVVEADVVVTIGGHVFEVRGSDSKPIVCEIPAGCHELVMRRGGLVLYEERFELHGGEGRVLTAWDPERLRRRLSAMPGFRIPDDLRGASRWRGSTGSCPVSSIYRR